MTLENKIESVFRRLKTKLSSTKRSNSVEELKNDTDILTVSQKRKRGTSLRTRRSLRKKEEQFNAVKENQMININNANNINLNSMVRIFKNLQIYKNLGFGHL